MGEKYYKEGGRSMVIRHEFITPIHYQNKIL